MQWREAHPEYNSVAVRFMADAQHTYHQFILYLNGEQSAGVRKLGWGEGELLHIVNQILNLTRKLW